MISSDDYVDNSVSFNGRVNGSSWKITQKSIREKFKLLFFFFLLK